MTCEIDLHYNKQKLIDIHSIGTQALAALSSHEVNYRV
jgi:hypothetical protein